jgi:coatomer protein complex subunit epsilon
MASAQYFVRQQFTLGAYKSLVDLSLPDENSPDYVLFLVYKARAHLALGDARGAAALVPAGATNVALRAVAAAAALAAAPASAREDALEPLREISLTLDDADTEGDAQDRGVARVLAGAAFAAAGETEEALETLGAGTQTENLEACVLPRTRALAGASG